MWHEHESIDANDFLRVHRFLHKKPLPRLDTVAKIEVGKVILCQPPKRYVVVDEDDLDVLIRNDFRTQALAEVRTPRAAGDIATTCSSHRRIRSPSGRGHGALRRTWTREPMTRTSAWVVIIRKFVA